jgi:hypothetical protein
VAAYYSHWETNYDSGEWRPRNWTIVCVSTVHLFFAAAVLTATPTPLPPPPLNVVDVVTIPNGSDQQQMSQPIDIEPKAKVDQIPQEVPKIDQRFGPRPSDRRTTPTPILKTESQPAPEVSPSPAPTLPSQVPAQIQQPPEPVPIIPPTSLPTPKPATIQQAAPPPIQATTPTLLPNVEAVPLKPAQVAPSLTLPDADPLAIKGAKLKLKQAPTLRPMDTLEIPAPPSPPASIPVPAPAPALRNMPTPTATPAKPTTPPIQRQLSPPPPFAAPAPAPLNVTNAKTPLPKVQLPRIRATDLRLPDAQAVPDAPPQAVPQSNAGGSSGVTSLLPRDPRGSAGAASAPPIAGGPGPSVGGAPSNGGGSGGGSAGGSGTSGGGGNAAGGGAGGAGASGPTGILPRRPGGASVPQPFPRGDSNTLLGRMDKTYDCSRLNRERDARCPEWGPIEGRNGRAASQFEVPVPKGLPTLRNPLGTNPLPPCPPGTPGSQMGLSCLPTREGPSIPKL